MISAVGILVSSAGASQVLSDQELEAISVGCCYGITSANFCTDAGDTGGSCRVTATGGGCTCGENDPGCGTQSYYILTGDAGGYRLGEPKSCGNRSVTQYTETCKYHKNWGNPYCNGPCVATGPVPVSCGSYTLLTTDGC